MKEEVSQHVRDVDVGRLSPSEQGSATVTGGVLSCTGYEDLDVAIAEAGDDDPVEDEEGYIYWDGRSGKNAMNTEDT
jgi:hypothetical protein